jgi:uncharacterized membrane protein YgaE (UPF0421/DUF939 family)
VSAEQRRWRRWLSEARAGGVRRVTANVWPILQAALAAGAAWAIATHLVHHRQPFFAPIAAVVSLNAARGERGSNAVRLVLGVIVGILVGELAIAVHGGGSGTVGVAALVAMLAALAISGDRLVIAQAAAGSILTVAALNGQVGSQRLVDALIGAGVALAISQLLFPAEPVALLRRAEEAAALALAEGLRLIAVALERDDDALAQRALDHLRETPSSIADLARARRSSTRVVRWSPVRRRRQGPVVREEENAAQLDLLGGSCLMLARAVMGGGGDARVELAAAVGDLATAVQALADALGDREARQHAADQALEIARRGAAREPGRISRVAFAWMTLRTVAMDVMVFAGIDPADAAAAVRQPNDELRIAPPAEPGMPFRGLGRRGGRRST